MGEGRGGKCGQNWLSVGIKNSFHYCKEDSRCEQKNIGQPAYIVRGVYSTKRIPAFITDPSVKSVDVSADINADADNNTDTELTAGAATGDDVCDVEVDDGVPELDVLHDQIELVAPRRN